MQATWLIKLILSHLLTDFILQPGLWIAGRKAKHFLSPYLYFHGLVTAGVALLLIGARYWPVVIAILVTHILIDGWKSYKPDNAKYFLIDQALHLIVLLVSWYLTFFTIDDVAEAWNELNTQKTFTLVTAYVFVTSPAGILIGQLTKKWREKIADAEALGNAGKWIGIIERLIILTLDLNHQYEAIGLLIAAKGLLRFNEANRPEPKTEYLLIGTLISISIALLAGLATLQLINS
jgi:hypothetical protein